MSIGAFSVSLAVKDIAASKAFYELLGFTEFGGDASQGWLILQNDNCTIGLFQGMFENNLMTFNPGWDQSAQPVEGATDIRAIQQELKSAGVAFQSEADETTSGPASFMITDPDGNQLLFDQHV